MRNVVRLVLAALVFWSGAVAHYWDPGQLRGAAMLNDVITRQANAIAYTDDFKLMLILALCSLPLVLLIRPEPRRMAGNGHAAVME